MGDENKFSIEKILEDDIFEIIGGANLSEEEKQQLLTQMLDTIRLRAIASVDEKLSEEDRNQLGVILDGENSPLKFEQFFKEKNVDIVQTMAEEAAKYKVELATYAQYMQKTGKSLQEVMAEINKVETNA